MDNPQNNHTQGKKTITVDAAKCIGCGLCVSSCGDVFELDENGKSRAKDAAACDKAGCCQQALDNCPSDAIAWEESKQLERVENG